MVGRAVDLPHPHIGRAHQARALRLLGDIAAQRDPLEVEPAEEHYRQAFADELGMRLLQAYCRLNLGTLHAKAGRREPARR